MATDKAIAATLAFLHELYPTRDISPATLDAFAIVFRDWSDAELRSCAQRAAQEQGRTFFPTPGEIANYRVRPSIDVDAILERIGAMGSHNPRVGWIYPRVEVVRDVLGHAIADAYGAAGGPSQLFARELNDGSHVSRDIARRAFHRDLETANRQGRYSGLLPASVSPKQIVTGEVLPLDHDQGDVDARPGLGEGPRR